ncbi:MAG: GLUG motif-containing protein [Planctomycetota bacterium]
MPKGVSILISIMLWLMVPSDSVFAYTYSGGTGEPNKPYLIATAEDMNSIGAHPNDWDKHFLLVNDINLADYTGTQFNIIGRDFGRPFTGVFDGNGHTISNFSWSTSSSGFRCIGLFGVLGIVDSNNMFYGEIKNLGLLNVDVNIAPFSDFIGSLTGFNDFGTITNCYASGMVFAGQRSGGLIGYNWEGTIRGCHSSVETSGDRSIGSLVGTNSAGTITECYATGKVYGNNSIGGLVGTNGEMVTKCYALGSVYGKQSTGGLVGYNSYGRVEDSYAKGSVYGTQYVGGLAGWNYGQSIINRCYSTGHVEGTSDFGGLVGDQYWDSPVVENSFWDIITSDCNSSDGGTGLPTDKLQKESTFTDAGWDFVEIWNIGENQTYPFLRIHPPGDINNDDIVNFFDLAILADHFLQSAQ